MNGEDKIKFLPTSMQFVVRFETNFQQVCRILQAAITTYKNEGHGTTIFIIQTALGKFQFVQKLFIVKFLLVTFYIVFFMFLF